MSCRHNFGTGLSTCHCAGCHETFTSISAFDVHQRIDGYSLRCLKQAGILRGNMIRDERRTTVITIGPDVIRVCEMPCRNVFLADLGIPGRGGWMYKPSGAADARVAFSGKDYHLTWKRCRPSDIYCDQCGDKWRSWLPPLIADAQARSDRLKGTAPPNRTRFKAA